MRRLWIVILGIIILIPVVLVVALSLVPDSVYRDRISAAVKSATGRDLTIGGKIGLSFRSGIGVGAEDVALANAPGFSAPVFASMKSLDAGIAIFPLLAGKVEIRRFVLVEPKIALEVDESGNNNWTFQSQKAAAAEAPQAQGEAAKKKGGIGDLSLGQVELVDGLVSYANRQTKENYEISAINIGVKLPSLDAPATLDGSAIWKGKKIALTLDTQKPRAIMDGTGAPLTLTVDTELAKAKFDGTAAGGDNPRLNGTTDLSVTSVRDLTAWLAKPMAPGQGFGPLAIKGKLAFAGKRVDFTDAAVLFDKIDGTGSVSVEARSERPYVKAELAVGLLDLNPYLGAGDNPPSSGSSGEGAPDGAAPAPASGGGWSTAPIDFTGLRAIDGDFAFQAKKILFNKMTFTDSVLSASLRNGLLSADLSKLALYGGTGKGRIVVIGGEGIPQISSDFAFANIDIQPFLKDGANFEKLEGTGNLTLSLRSQGASQKALAQNLNGSGAMKLVNGAIRGINLAAMVRNLSGAFSGGVDGGEQKTDFASLGGTWTIANGVLKNSDMELLNPLLRVTGAGTADIGNRTVDYRIMPKAVASLEGQGGKTDVTGISVPVKVAGSWDNLKFAPDTKGLLEGALKGAVGAQGAGQDPLKGALKGLLGQPAEKAAPEEPSSPPAKKQDPGKDLLKGILGGQ